MCVRQFLLSQLEIHLLLQFTPWLRWRPLFWNIWILEKQEYLMIWNFLRSIFLVQQRAMYSQFSSRSVIDMNRRKRSTCSVGLLGFRTYSTQQFYLYKSQFLPSPWLFTVFRASSISTVNTVDGWEKMEIILHEAPTNILYVGPVGEHVSSPKQCCHFMLFWCSHLL